jgi:AraC-like DNA-binding protein
MFVHSSRFQKQLDYLQTRGGDTDHILGALSIERKEVLDPEKTFTLDQFIALLDLALKETGDELYGLKMGKEPHIAGTVGMMCASCENLKEAYVQGCKYFNVQGDFAEIEFIDDSQYPRVKYTIAQSWLLKSPETARQEVEAMFSFLATIMQVNSNHTLHPHRIKLASIQAADLLEYRNILGVLPEFDQAENEIQFRNKDLLIPMKAFNPETFELLRSHVEAQLKRLSSASGISEKVRTILLTSLRYNFPDIETVASRLNMSPRTLQRQLSNEKTNFKTLLHNTLFDLAKQMLRKKDLTISEISYMLGYSDLGNFSRSFKRKIGCSPLEYRQKKSTHA